MKQGIEQNKIFEQKCNLLLNEKEIRYIGTISKMGSQMAGSYKAPITPLVDEEEYKICLEHTLEIMLTRDLDEALGSIDSIVTKRKKVMKITIPMRDFSLLISAEKSADSEKIIKKIFRFFKKNNQLSNLQNYDKDHQEK